MSEEYYHTPESVQEYIRLSKDVSGKNLIAHLKKHLAPQSHLLELGTGPGTDWLILKDDFKVIGSDLSLEFLKHLTQEYKDGQFVQLDAITLEIQKTFDGIYSNKVLHHLQDEELHASIKRQHAILTKDGILCHSFWSGEGSEIFKGMFVNYHTKSNLESFFTHYFEILYLEEYAEFDKGDSLLLIGKKK